MRCLMLMLVLLAACSRKDPASEQARLESEFEKMLTNATLAGKFSMGERVTEDHYQISKVTHVAGDSWLVHAKVGKRDISIPIPVTVKWAGDTPVIMLTDAGIPGLGTFTARVLFYRNQYAGTWSNPKHGGEMWGRVEH